MKKKILVSVVVLVVAITAGVNYRMINDFARKSNLTLSSLVKMTIAQAEFGQTCSICGNDLDDCTCNIHITTTGDAWTDGCTASSVSYEYSSTMTGGLGTSTTTTYYPGTYTYCDCSHSAVCDSAPCS